MLYLFVALKLPILAAGYLICGGGKPRPHPAPTLPHAPRRGPHREPAPPSPPRVRNTRVQSREPRH